MAKALGYNWTADPRTYLNRDETNAPPDESASILGDLALAVPRGIVGAVQGVYGAADLLTFDALPDWEKNPLGESETAAGGLVEGITQFAAGFVPILGQVGKIGKLGRFGKYAVAGAVTDFTVFDGHEARLSNLLRDHAGLENPITDFLAADDSDPEIVGRLKNALEGLGVGSFVDVLAMSLRGIKRYRQKVAQGMDKAEAAREAAQEIKAEEFQLPEGKVEAESFTSAQASETSLPSPQKVEDAKVEDAKVKAVKVEDTLRNLGIDPAKITPEALQADISRRAKMFAEAGISPAVNPRNLTTAELAITELDAKGLNLRDVRTAEDAALLGRGIEAILPPLRTVTIEELHTEAKATADLFASKPDELLASMKNLGDDITAGVRRLQVARAVYEQQLKSFGDVAVDFYKAGRPDEMRADLLLRAKTLAELQRSLHVTRSEFGRGLGSLRHSLGSSILDPALQRKLVDEAGGADKADDFIKAVLDANAQSGPAAASAIIKNTVGRKTWNVLYEVWHQGILSHPRTSVVSGTSAAVATIYRPIEMLLAGAARRAVGADPKGEAISAAIGQVVNLKEMVPAAWKAAKSSWLNEENRLASAGLAENNRSISAKNLGLENHPYASIVDSVGRIVRTPGRILSAQDEGFGTLSYRAIVKERLESAKLAEYRAKGLPDEQALAAAQDELDKMIVNGQAYSRKALYEDGYAKARASMPEATANEWSSAAAQYVKDNFDKRLGSLAEQTLKDIQRDITLTHPLDTRSSNALISSAARIQQLVNAHPVLKPFLPFIRTPTNIAVWAGQRFDVVGVAKLLAIERFPEYAKNLNIEKHRYLQDMLSGDQVRQAQATGRLFTGVGISVAVTTMAANNQITGRGPKDPNLRKLLEAGGWQPYSIKIGDRYYSYSRIDPLATLFGTFADMYEWSRWAPEESRGEATTLGWGLAIGIANNVTNKTYFTGLMRLTEVLSDPAGAAEKTARSYAGSVVPNFMAALVPSLGGDDYLREMRTMTDAMLRKVPGFSDSVAPRRNLLGEPVSWNRVLGDDVGGDYAAIFSPISMSAVSDDTIWNELASLEKAFEPPRRFRNGMDLTTFSNGKGQDAYDRWQELSGTIRIRGVTMKDSLRKLIRSKDYQRLPAESSLEAQSPRVSEIKSVLEQYRSVAYQQVLKEYKELAAEDRRIFLLRKDLKRGVDRRIPQGSQ